MIVKPSAILNTYHGRFWVTIMSVEEMDADPTYDIDPVVMRLLEESPIKIVLSPADGEIADGDMHGITTMDLESGEPAIVLYYTKTTSLWDFVNVVEHELIHAQQILDGRLSYAAYDDMEHLIWEGEMVVSLPVPTIADTTPAGIAAATISAMRYYSQPWEFEAMHDEWTMSFCGRKWPEMVIARYGTLWPAHWSAKYVYKRLIQLRSVSKLIAEFVEEGY